MRPSALEPRAAVIVFFALIHDGGAATFASVGAATLSATQQRPGGDVTMWPLQAADADYGGFWGPWQDDAAFAALVAAPAPACDDCM